MRIALIGNFTLDFIGAEIKKKISAEFYLSGFNQYQIEIFNDKSNLYSFQPDVIILFLDGHTLFYNKDLLQVQNEIVELYEKINLNYKGYFIVNNVHLYNYINKIYDYNNENNNKQIQNNFNLFLNQLSVKYDNLFVLDILTEIEKYGFANLYDNSIWSFAKSRFNKKGNIITADKTKILIDAILNNHKKCIIVDLDNTLWGGIIGEDGIAGIQLAQDNQGKHYIEFQKKLLKIKEKGILLCICSKNNEQDAKEVFDNHPEMFLKWDDFVIRKINWNNKANNITEIAQELNIGADSIVFIDDNPYERQLVSTQTNAVVPEFPDKIENLPDFISEIDLKYFSKFKITEEDKEKTQQYVSNKKRAEVEKKSNSMEDFLHSLKMELVIKRVNQNLVPRIAQMTQKTNQFNFTTRRYTEKNIEAMLNDNRYNVICGDVKDMYGDYGTVILIITEEINDRIELNTFLMSCRVIGRLVEIEFLLGLKNYLIATSKVYGLYYPTKKNVLVVNKFDELGFPVVFENEERKEYIIDLNKIKSSNLIKVTYE